MVRVRRRLTLSILVAVGLLATTFFGVQACNTWRALQAAPATRTQGGIRIQPWMSVRFIARAYRVPVADLAQHLNAPPRGDTTLLELARERSLPVQQVQDDARQAVIELGATTPITDPPRGRPAP